MKTTRILIAAILSALALPSFAEEKKEPAQAEVQVKIPETAEALWTEIDVKFKALAEIVAAKKGDSVVDAAETVEALVNAIPSKHADLAADKKKRIEGQTKNVARVLDELHDGAKEGHWDVAAKKLTQVEAAIKIIKGQVSK